MWVAGFWCRSGGVQCSSSGCTGSSSRGAAGTATRIRTSRRFSGARIWRLPSGGIGLARSASEHRYTSIDDEQENLLKRLLFQFSGVVGVLDSVFLFSLSFSFYLHIYLPLFLYITICLHVLRKPIVCLYTIVILQRAILPSDLLILVSLKIRVSRASGTFRSLSVNFDVSKSCVSSFLFTGLGLGASSTARRDSFDRNTSAFSPSLEYSRAKWPQSYGALGMG